MKIDHIAIAVNDVEESAKIYQQALGVDAFYQKYTKDYDRDKYERIMSQKSYAAKIAASGPKDKLTGKFQGDIIPTVPNGSYFTYDFAPNKPKGKFDDRFSTLVHFLIFLIALLISGIMLYASVIIDVFFDLLP